MSVIKKYSKLFVFCRNHDFRMLQKLKKKNPKPKKPKALLSTFHNIHQTIKTPPDYLHIFIDYYLHATLSFPCSFYYYPISNGLSSPMFKVQEIQNKWHELQYVWRTSFPSFVYLIPNRMILFSNCPII